jgi:Flp pilus assembly protein TadD
MVHPHPIPARRDAADGEAAGQPADAIDATGWSNLDNGTFSGSRVQQHAKDSHMNKNAYSVAFTMLFVFLAAVPPSSAVHADPAAVLPAERRKAEAAALLDRGEAGKAYEICMRLLRENPEDDAVFLGLARASTAARRWNQAVSAYESLLEKYPRDPSLYGELANVYMLLGDREAAERSLAVMRSLDGRISREAADASLDRLEKAYSNVQIHGKVRFGVLYDSNANMGPNSDTLDLDNWRVRVDDAKRRESMGAYAGAEIDLSRRFYRDSPWHLVGDAQGFWRGYAAHELDATRNREAQWGRGAAGLRHLTATTLVEARVKAEIFDYELWQHVAAYGPEAAALWAASPSAHLLVRGALDKREYSRDHLRDGMYGWAGVFGRFFLGQDRHELLLGGRWLGASAEEADYGYSGWEAMVSARFKLPYNFELAPAVSWTEEQYRGPATALESKDRRDERLRAGVGLTYRISESWALESNWQYARNHSRSELYTYDQHYVSLGMAWSF